jgi:UDP-N-acetylglucosamine pyrophosphorylase
LESKKFGLVILAAGDATRLNLQQPKACVEIFGISLLERLMAKTTNPIAIMTSKTNYQKIIEHLEKKNLMRSNVIVFQQSCKPYLVGTGENPCGNGDLFRAFVHSKAFETFALWNVCRVVVCPIDNPLADPKLDCLHEDYDLNVLGIEKLEGESVGTLILEDKLSVVEYTKSKTQHGLGYSGIFSATMDFFYRAYLHDSQVPFHHVEKNVGNQKVIKLEKFIFDFFALAKSYRVVKIDRNQFFLPIKNLTGADSLEVALQRLKS